MKAIVYSEYGSPEVLHLADLKKPSPKDNEVLIRVYATSVNFGDLTARNYKALTPRRFNMLFLFWLMAKLSFGINKPNNPVLGSEFSGEIEAIGKNVKSFKPGDQVFGYSGQSMGAYAEYICQPENGVVAIKPVNISWCEAAASTYGSIMAVNLLQKANIKPGQKVLIIGASGSIGSAAVQLAKIAGAEVTGVCSKPGMDYVRSLGADAVIDYSREDFTQNGNRYDLIFDVLGRSSFSGCRNSLTKNGIYLLASFKEKQLLQMLWTSISDGRKVVCALAPGGIDDLRAVTKLIEQNKIRPVIDRTFPMEMASEAHRYAERGHKKGSVILTMLN